MSTTATAAPETPASVPPPADAAPVTASPSPAIEQAPAPAAQPESPALSRPTRVVGPVWQEPGADPAPAPKPTQPTAAPAAEKPTEPATPDPATPDPAKAEWDVERQKVSQKLTTAERQLTAEREATQSLQTRLAAIEHQLAAPQPAKPSSTPAAKPTEPLVATPDGLDKMIADLQDASYIEPGDLVAVLKTLKDAATAASKGHKAGQPDEAAINAAVAKVLAQRDAQQQSMVAANQAFETAFAAEHPSVAGHLSTLVAAANTRFDAMYQGIEMSDNIAQAKFDLLFTEQVSAAEQQAKASATPAPALKPTPKPAAPPAASAAPARSAPRAPQGTDTVPSSAISGRPTFRPQREVGNVWIND